MCDSTVVTELPESSYWHGVMDAEDAQSVRRRHAEQVEAWLDGASFASELFKLHEKYGIDMGEEGYAAYRKYLAASYYQKLRTSGPAVDPLDEGCQCLFCQFDEEAALAASEESAIEQPQETGRVRCADQSNVDQLDSNQSDSNQSDRNQSDVCGSQGHEQEPKSDSRFEAHGPHSGFCDGSLNGEPSEIDEYDPSVYRYDSVGGVEPAWEPSPEELRQSIVPVDQPGVRRSGFVAAEPVASNHQSERRPDRHATRRNTGARLPAPRFAAASVRYARDQSEVSHRREKKRGPVAACQRERGPPESAVPA